MFRFATLLTHTHFDPMLAYVGEERRKHLLKLLGWRRRRPKAHKQSSIERKIDQNCQE